MEAVRLLIVDTNNGIRLQEPMPWMFCNRRCSNVNSNPTVSAGADQNGCSSTYYTFSTIGQWNPYADFNAPMPSALSAAPYNFPTTETTSGFPSGWQIKIISVGSVNHTCNFGSNTHIYSTSDYEGNIYHRWIKK